MRKYSVLAVPLVLLVVAIFQLACGGGTATTPDAVYDAAHSPTGLQWGVGNERISLSWNAVAFAAGYKIYISTNGVDFNIYTGNDPIPDTQIIVTQVENGKAYYLAVTAVGSSGKETARSYPGGTPDAVELIPTSVIGDDEIGVPPAPPANLQGLSGDRIVQLIWDENTEKDFDEYIVYFRRAAVSSFSAFPAQEDNFFEHNDVQNGTTYYYQVRARDLEELLSGPSNTVKYTPASAPPLKPANFTATFVNFVGVVLDWTPSLELDVIEYRLIRYDWTDDEIDPVIDTLIITLPFPPPVEFGTYPPLTDVFIIQGHEYEYELASKDVDGQYSPPALSGRVIVPDAE
jgi:hypothetical protein